MTALSTEHLLLLAATALIVPALLALAGRPGTGRAVELGLATALASGYVAFLAIDGARGRLSARDDLPLDISDLAALVAIVALVGGAPLAVALTWFWGLAGAVPALLTPDLGSSFPDYRWWWFGIAHVGAVAAALVLVVGRRRPAGPAAGRRAFAVTLGVAAVAAAADLALGANYMFLAEPPAADTPLDLLGPWPWYIAGGAALAVALFALLDLPLRRQRRMSHEVMPR